MCLYPYIMYIRIDVTLTGKIGISPCLTVGMNPEAVRGDPVVRASLLIPFRDLDIDPATF